MVHGFPAAGHRTKNVRFDNIRLPAGAVVQLDRTEDVSFSGLTTADGQKPAFEIKRSERVVY